MGRLYSFPACTLYGYPFVGSGIGMGWFIFVFFLVGRGRGIFSGLFFFSFFPDDLGNAVYRALPDCVLSHNQLVFHWFSQ